MKLTSGSRNSVGMDIMRRINDGELKKAPVPYIESIKGKITANCEEIVEQGARIRPLMAGDDQVGWCRGVHSSERAQLKRWIKDPNDYILHMLLLGTSFTREEIEVMDAVEVRALTEVIQQMSAYDSSLIPYLSAFSSTSISETLWDSKRDSLASWENREVRLPDGKVMKIMCPPVHARFWVSLCTYRDMSKKRLEQNYNSLFIVRPWAGRSADPIQGELDRVARSLETNAMEPWENVVRAVSTVDKNDGWAHPGDTLEDLQRELKGMMSGDKHEQLMEAWANQMKAEQEAQRKKLEEERKKRGTDRVGIVSETIEVLTDKQVRERQAALQSGRKAQPAGVVRRETHEVDATDRQLDKVRKYR
jgi:hypothetical protein